MPEDSLPPWHEASDDRPWRHETPSDHPSFFGYETQLTVAKHWARAAQTRPRFAFLFGFPGTGKSSLCKRLCWELQEEGTASSLVTIKCIEIATMPSQEARDLVPHISRHIENHGDVLQVVLLDEIDCMAPNAPARTTTASWAIRLIKGIRDRKLPAFVICATNWPFETDETIQSETNQNIYCDPPSPEVMEAIVADSLAVGTDIARRIVERYNEIAEERHAVPMTRRLVLAAEDLKVVPGWQSLPADNLAESLYRMGTPPSQEDFNKWVDRHKALIEAYEGVARLFTTGAKQKETHE